MAKISLSGFKDPVRRPRYIIWTGVAVLVLAAVMIVALGVTSTFWFCSEGCHKVQDDTIIAYQRSSHSKISCMACHMPAGANPVVFILHKAEALGELYLTVTDNFELPLNAESEVSLVMKSTQCTQCHNLETRNVTPARASRSITRSRGGQRCLPGVPQPNRARRGLRAHPDRPATGEPNQPHADFMSMTACFRCHGLEKGAGAPGECAACHTPGFNLKPPSHSEAGFYPKGHAEMAMEAKAEVDKAKARATKVKALRARVPRVPRARAPAVEETTPAESDETSFLTAEKAYASGGEAAESVPKEEVPQVLAAQRSHGSDPSESIGATSRQSTRSSTAAPATPSSSASTATAWRCRTRPSSRSRRTSRIRRDTRSSRRSSRTSA